MGTPTRIYTRSEQAERTRLLLKGAKNSAGDISTIERKIDRIDERAEDRARREIAAHERQLEAAKDELAAAKVHERAATREERDRAREARKDAEKRLRQVERAAPR